MNGSSSLPSCLSRMFYKYLKFIMSPTEVIVTIFAALGWQAFTCFPSSDLVLIFHMCKLGSSA